MFTGENDKSATLQTTTGNTDSINNAQQRSGNKQNTNRNTSVVAISVLFIFAPLLSNLN